VFERYTEKARRAIFFARYEAATFGSAYIDTDHLLLGLMREDAVLKAHLRPPATDETFRKQVDAHSTERLKIATSVDLPLSQPCKRALHYAADESERLQQKFIGPGHLVLGLLHLEEGLAADFLKQSGIHLVMYRDVVRASPADTPGPPEGRLAEEEKPSSAPRGPQAPRAPQLASSIGVLESLIELEIAHLNPYQRLKRKPWTRQEALGHLVDLAMWHHQLLERALTEPAVAISGSPPDHQGVAQIYRHYPWEQLVPLWISLNRLLAHVLTVIPEEKLAIACRIGVEEPRTLLVVIQHYVGACEDLVGQMLAKLE